MDTVGGCAGLQPPPPGLNLLLVPITRARLDRATQQIIDRMCDKNTNFMRGTLHDDATCDAISMVLWEGDTNNSDVRLAWPMMRAALHGLLLEEGIGLPLPQDAEELKGAAAWTRWAGVKGLIKDSRSEDWRRRIDQAEKRRMATVSRRTRF